MPHENPAYWQLVEQLMRYGWYRGGCDRERDPSGHSWRFREGHIAEARRPDPLWISAADEATAMRILLEQLQGAGAGRRVRSGAEGD
jgi:hypothetical protein